MTTLQIILLSILFIIDFSLSIAIPIYKDKDLLLLPYNMVRLIYVWVLLIIALAYIVDLKKKSIGKCPNIELIQEPIYRIKK